MSPSTATPRDAIVCVDDEPLVLHALQGALARKLGPRFVIELASNGAEAIELIDELSREQTRLRLVVSDAIMPIMDGYALVEWLHAHRPEVLKIIVTGYSHEGRINQLRQEAGLLACFPKPWKHEELLAFIESALAEA